MRHTTKGLVLGSFIALTGTATFAGVVQVQVTAQNLAPANSLGFAPLHFGFGNGTFDSFDNGTVAFNTGDIATAPIVTIAEGGSGSTWLPAFAAAEPNATIGSVTGPTGGPFVPGAVNSAVFSVDTSNRYFTFGSMAVPSNDRFVGNDDPRAFPVFDPSGNLVLNTIVQKTRDIWDAGSETDEPANAAFLVIGTNSQRVNQNGVVAFNSDFSAYNGLTTAAGYTFNSNLLSANDDVLRISFAIVPEPTSAAAGATILASIGGSWLLRRRQRQPV